MAEINDLNITDASNTARFPENQSPSSLNDGARALEGLIARWHKDTNGSTASTGSANAYVFAANQTLSAYYDGLEITFDANHTNTGASTLNVDAVGAASIVWPDGTALAAGDIVSGAKITVRYDGTNWQLCTLSVAPGALASQDSVDGTEIVIGSDTQGDVLYYNGSAWTRLAAGTSGQYLQTQGAGANPQWAGLSGNYTEVLDKDPTENDIVNTAAETTLYTYTIPANTLGTDKAVRVSLRGDYLNNSGAGRTFTLRVKYGATTLYADATSSIAANASRYAWNIDFILTAVDSASAQLVNGALNFTLDPGGVTTGIGGMLQGSSAAAGGPFEGTSAEDSTGALALTVTIEHSAANANLSFRRKIAVTELLP